MYTTLSPCDMCTGACVLYKVGRVVIGENRTFVGGEAYLKQRGIEVVVLQDEECEALMKRFIQEKPDVWYVPLLVFKAPNLLRDWSPILNVSAHDRNEDIGE